MIHLAIALFINIITTPIFIIALGNKVEGAALGTILSMLFYSILNLHYFLSGKGSFGLGSFKFIASFENYREILSIGASGLLVQITQFIRQIIIFKSMAYYGNVHDTVLRNLGNKKKPQSIMVSASYQRASDKAGYEGGDQKSDFMSMNASYSYSVVPTNTTLAMGGNIYDNHVADIHTTYWGPTFSITKAFYQKTLRASWASSYNKTSGNILTSPVLNNRMSINFSPKPKEAGSASPHNLAFGLNILNRLKSTEQQPAFTEFTGTVNYTYTF